MWLHRAVCLSWKTQMVCRMTTSIQVQDPVTPEGGVCNELIHLALASIWRSATGLQAMVALVTVTITLHHPTHPQAKECSLQYLAASNQAHNQCGQHGKGRIYMQ